MFDVVTDFAPGARVRTDVQAIRRTALHAHPNALEIVYVLAGTLHVRVSSEDFDLSAGDYVVINQLDPHLLEGSDDNITAIMHFDLAAFTEIDPFADRILFACESFDLPRYRKQEALLRGILLDLTDSAVVGLDAKRLDARATELVGLLCTGYSIEDYYQRDRELTEAQRTKLHGIAAATRSHFGSRDVLQDVANSHHYSKSYVSHFVKNTSAISFSNMVTALRVMHAERLLLTTEYTMRDVSAQCGFSDVKYFTRCFLDWFKQTPAEYRAQYRPLTQRDDSIDDVDAETTAGLVEDHRSRVAAPTDPPRLSITPIVLKNVGSRFDLFDRIGEFTTDDPMPKRPSGSGRSRRHLLPMPIDSAELSGDRLIHRLASFAEIDATPCLVVEYCGRQPTVDVLSRLAGLLHDIGKIKVGVWLVYARLHMRDDVDEVINVAEEQYGLSVHGVIVN